MARHRTTWRLLAWAAAAAVALIGLLFAPVFPYHPACDTWRDEPIKAPLRPIYADLLAHSLAEEGDLFLRFGNRLYLPLLDLPHLLGRHPAFARDFVNDEWRHALSIAHGYRVAGGGFPSPAAVQRLLARWEKEHQAALPRDRHGILTLAAVDRLGCALIRAALTTADDLPGDDLLGDPP